MQASAPHEPIRPLRLSPFAGGTMRSPAFDLLFVGGLIAIGLTAGGAAASTVGTTKISARSTTRG